MQGPVVDLALLCLLVLFFGRQQSGRPEVYFRFWFAGWVLVFLSYGLWEVKLTKPLLVQIQEALTFDLILLGLLIFLTSFVATVPKLRRTVALGACIGVPTVLLMNIRVFAPVSQWWLALAVVVWEAYGVRATYVLVPKGRVKTRALLYGLCAGFAIAILVYFWKSPTDELAEWALAEVALSTAVLYGGGIQKRTLAVYVGVAGFTAWAAFYLAALGLSDHPQTLRVVYEFWNFPKYFVGFSMILKTFEEVTAEKSQLAEQYKSLYDDFRMLYEGHPQAMWIFEAEGGRFLSANAAAMSQYGFSLDEFLAMKPEEMFLISDAEQALIESVYPESKLRFARHRYKDGRIIWANVDTHAIQFAGKEATLLSAWDVTEQLDSRRRLAHQANHDVLTGLPNRTLLADRMEQCFARCEREGRKAAMLTIDVDHFKRVNDTYGHAVGDQCLQIVAARLAGKIRGVDTIARTGGEEFGAIVGGLHTAADAEKVAEALLAVFASPLRLGDFDLPVTVSIGVAVYPDDGMDAETLKVRSDEALYAAKRGGRNRAEYAVRGTGEAEVVGAGSVGGRR